MTTAWLVFRVVKFTGVALFGAGLVGAFLPERQRERLVAAQWVAPAGLLLTWIGGYGLMKDAGLGFREPWIGLGMLASLIATGGALVGATNARSSPSAAGVAAAGLLAAVGAMVTRGAGGVLLATSVGLAAALGYAAGRTASRGHHGDADHARAATRSWFAWVARVEGASLLFMLGISMPLRKLAGISIDGGQGWVGWTHGMLTMLYLLAIDRAARADGWSKGRVALGILASGLPFGTFAFERWQRGRGPGRGAP